MVTCIPALQADMVWDLLAHTMHSFVIRVQGVYTTYGNCHKRPIERSEKSDGSIMLMTGKSLDCEVIHIYTKGKRSVYWEQGGQKKKRDIIMLQDQHQISSETFNIQTT